MYPARLNQMAELIRDLAMVIRPRPRSDGHSLAVNGVRDGFYLAKISHPHWPACKGTKLLGAMA
jgi:hypothetical protein